MTVRSSNLGTNEMFGDGGPHSPENLQQKSPWKMAFAGRGSGFPFVKKTLVGGWTNPSEKYDRQIGSVSQNTPDGRNPAPTGMYETL